MSKEGKSKGTRGATKMTGLTKSSHRNRLPIQFDGVGNPIGPNRVQFVSYVGMLLFKLLYLFLNMLFNYSI